MVEKNIKKINTLKISTLKWALSLKGFTCRIIYYGEGD